MDIGVKVLIGLMLPPLAALLYVTFLAAVYEIRKIIKRKRHGNGKWGCSCHSNGNPHSNRGPRHLF